MIGKKTCNRLIFISFLAFLAQIIIAQILASGGVLVSDGIFIYVIAALGIFTLACLLYFAFVSIFSYFALSIIQTHPTFWKSVDTPFLRVAVWREVVLKLRE